MADYKLRVDVDEAELTKKLKRAVEKAFGEITLGGASGGNGFLDELQKQGAKLTKQTEFQYEQQKKLILLRSKERQALEQMIRARQVEQKLLAKQNALIRLSGTREQQTYKNIFGLIAGRSGGAAGKAMDYSIAKIQGYKDRKKAQRERFMAEANAAYERGEIDLPMKAKRMANYDKNHTNKLEKVMNSASDMWKKSKLGKSKVGQAMSKAGTPIKIAGIAAGLAAGGGLAKMIIDASPLLQAMLKLLNVGIMLILRPIGDFIGFMLRPLLIEFVKKIAVPMYKQGFQAAKSWGTQLGKALLGFFLDPARFAWDNLVKPILDFFKGMELFGAKPFENIKTEYPWIPEEGSRYDEIMGLMGDEYDKLLAKSKAGQEPLGFGPNGQPVQGPVQQIAETEDESLAVEQEQLIALQAIQELLTPQQKTTPHGKFKSAEAQQAALKAQFATNFSDPTMSKHFQQYLNWDKEKIPDWMMSCPTFAQALQDKRMEDSRKGGTTQTNYSGMSLEERMAAEAARAQGYYGKDNFANPLHSTGGYLGTQTFKERFLDRGAGDRALSAKLFDEKMAQVYGKERWEQMKKRGGVDTFAGTNTSGVGHTGVGSGGYYNQASDIDPEMTARDYWSKSGRFTGTITDPSTAGSEIPSEEEMQELILEPMEASHKTWFDGTNVIKQFTDEIRATTEDMLGLKNEEKNNATDSRHSSDAIAAEMANAESAIQCANEAGGKVADGLWTLWDKVDQALNRMRVYTNSKGRRPYKRVATAALQELGVKAYVQDEQDDRWLITWPKTDSQPARSATMNLSAAALVKYQELAAQGSLSMIKLARGGIINEPILGMGQKSGRRYLMGEAGPETITPGANTSPGTTGGNTFNITINAKDVGDIERQLKPTVLRILKESTSRAGIV